MQSCFENSTESMSMNENPSLSNWWFCHFTLFDMFSVGYKVCSQGTKIYNCCPYKSLLHAKPSASVNTAVHIGGVYATDKLRRVELYSEEVSNKQLYICILSDVSCKCTDNRNSVKHFLFVWIHSAKFSCWLGVSAHLSSVLWDSTAQVFFI